jgi:hypothetical protein
MTEAGGTAETMMTMVNWNTGDLTDLMPVYP